MPVKCDHRIQQHTLKVVLFFFFKKKSHFMFSVSLISLMCWKPFASSRKQKCEKAITL